MKLEVIGSIFARIMIDDIGYQAAYVVKDESNKKLTVWPEAPKIVFKIIIQMNTKCCHTDTVVIAAMAR